MAFPRWPLLVLAPLAALAPPLAAADDIRVGAGTVEDTRSLDGGRLAIELKVTGPLTEDVKAVRVNVKSAKDDKGTSLWKPDPEKKEADFEEFSVNRNPKPKLSLKSPARDASSVDVVGDVELFMPKRDPSTEQKIPKFLAKLDKPIANGALKAAKIEITPLSIAEYKAREAKNRPTKEQIVAEGKKHGASEKEIEAMVKLMEAFASMPGSDPGENTLLFEVKDPEGKLLGVDLLDKEGQVASAQMRSSSGGSEHKTMQMTYGEKPPADSTLLVTVRTAKSVMTVPLEMKGVPLP